MIIMKTMAPAPPEPLPPDAFFRVLAAIPAGNSPTGKDT